MKCPYCDTELELGQAIRTPDSEYNGCRCRLFEPTVLTIETLSFQFCAKCPNCGFSDDDVTDWADEIIERVGYDKWKEEYGQQYDRRMREEIL